MLRLIVEQEQRRGTPLPVDAIIALSCLRHERRLDTAMLAEAVQRDEAAARATLERLVESGLVEAHGVKRQRTFTLSAKVYRELGESADYVHQAGFDQIQQEQMVLQYAQTHGQIARREAMALCRVSEDQASRLLRKLLSKRICEDEARAERFTMSLLNRERIAHRAIRRLFCAILRRPRCSFQLGRVDDHPVIRWRITRWRK